MEGFTEIITSLEETPVLGSSGEGGTIGVSWRRSMLPSL